MPFPSGWPPRPASGRRSIRFYVTDTATANFDDKAYLFFDDVGANTINPTFLVEHGKESLVSPIGVPNPLFEAGDSPLGTGRNSKDTYYHPKVFQRRNGDSSVSFTLSGSTITLTDYNASPDFGLHLINKEIRISGATTAGNDGTFLITGSPFPHSITYENSSGASEALPTAGEYRIRVLDESPPKPMIWANTIRIINLGGSDLEISFDGVNVHGLIPGGEIFSYRNRFEAGIAIRGTGIGYVIEAW